MEIDHFILRNCMKENSEHGKIISAALPSLVTVFFFFDNEIRCKECFGHFLKLMQGLHISFFSIFLISGDKMIKLS